MRRECLITAVLALLLHPSVSEGQLLPTRRDTLAREALLKVPGNELDLSFIRSQEDSVTLFFIGDVMSHGPVTENAFAMYRNRKPEADRNRHGSYDYTSFFRALEGRISEADFAICNMEFPLAGPPFTGYPCFSAPDTYPEYLSAIGFDVLLTANNHILDKGDRGLRRTVEVCDGMESRGLFRYTGIAADERQDRKRNPLILEKDGVRIALVNFTYGTNCGSQSAWPKVNRMDRASIGEAIRRAREAGADVIVALPHWGTEYQLRHSREQEDLARWMVGEGVDLVIGTHPHVVQDHQTIRGKHVLYSLGNAVSNQMDLKTRLELCARVCIRVRRNGFIDIEEPRVTYLWCTKPGMVGDSFTVLPVREAMETPGLWRQEADYRNMVDTYWKVQKENQLYEENDPARSH